MKRVDEMVPVTSKNPGEACVRQQKESRLMILKDRAN